MTFAGYPSAMISAALAEAATRLDVKAPEIWTVFAIETSGCGFWSDRSPQILYERHIFWRLTNGAYKNTPDISNPVSGGYGPTGKAQYDRLAQATQLNEVAALESTSWGLGQILGSNYHEAGFANVNAMVAAMVLSEESQLSAFTCFLQSRGLDKDLQSHNWASFARGYNGPH